MNIIESSRYKQKLISYCMNEKNHVAAVTEGINQADVLSLTGVFAIEYEVKLTKADLKSELDIIEIMLECLKDKINDPGDKVKQLQLLGATDEELKVAGERYFPKPKRYEKYNKHKSYLNAQYWIGRRKELEEDQSLGYWDRYRKISALPRFIPNYFNFVVDKKLVDYAIDKLSGTPYGLIALDCRNKYKKGAMPSWHISGCGTRCYDEVAVVKPAKRLHNEHVGREHIISILHRMALESTTLREELIVRDSELTKGQYIYVCRCTAYCPHAKEALSTK